MNHDIRVELGYDTERGGDLIQLVCSCEWWTAVDEFPTPVQVLVAALTHYTEVYTEEPWAGLIHRLAGDVAILNNTLEMAGQ